MFERRTKRSLETRIKNKTAKDGGCSAAKEGGL
jgi:hypothetical protein